MPDARDRFFRLYNLPDDARRMSFFDAVHDWIREVKMLVFSQGSGRKPKKLTATCESAWEKTGIRCQAAELLAEDDTDEARNQVSIILEIVDKVLSFGPANMGVITVHELTQKSMALTAAEKMVFVWLETKDLRNASDSLWWLNHQIHLGRPCGIFSLTFGPSEPIAYEEGRNLSASLSQSQMRAAQELRILISAKHSQMSVCSFRPRMNTLIIGPSGSGKTHAVRAAAQELRLAMMEMSLGTWMPAGSRTSLPTQLRIARFVQGHRGGILFVDEADKLQLSPNHQLASDWTRYLLDELLSLLDGRVAEWEGWNDELAQKLRVQFHVVLAGAWQPAYSAAFQAHSALGGTWDNLSIADTFLDANWLPEEILYRINAHVVEISPPNIEQVRQQIADIDSEMGIPYDHSRVDAIAKDIVAERSGYRGIEKHIIANLILINMPVPPAVPPHLEQGDIPF